VVVWEVREITSGERGSRSTSGETRRGEKRDEGIGREEGAKGSLRGHPCQPGDGHFAKNFRFVCTRRSEPGGTTNTDAYARHAALPSLAPPHSLSLSLSLPVHPRFIPRGVSVRDRELFGTPMDPGRFSACENSRKSNLVVGARPTTRSGVLPSVGNNDASEQRVFTNHRLS